MSYDFEAGAKVTGSKFFFVSGNDAALEWKLMDYMIQFHVKNGYQFIMVPHLVNKRTATMAGLLPRFEGEYYQTTEGFMLIPTAETPLVGLHQDQLIDEAQLPIRYVAISPCYRKEHIAGGHKNRGLKRVHQFWKVELFVICTPDQEQPEYNKMLSGVLDLLRSLGLRYRHVELSETDRSPVATKTYDVELYYQDQDSTEDEWLEVSSVSSTGTNQSKLAEIRYRPTGCATKEDLKAKHGLKSWPHVHMLNGSGVAIPRLVLARSSQAELTRIAQAADLERHFKKD